MGMDVDSGSKRKVKPTMNITPLVDVVLVLLIIFMVVTPMMAKQLWLNVPPKPEENLPPPPPDALPPLVLTVGKDHLTRVNNEVIDRAELPARLMRMLNARPDKVVFFDADSSLPYGEAIEVMDLVRSGGVPSLAVLAEEVASAPLATAQP